MRIGELRNELAVFDDKREILIITSNGLEPVDGIVMEYGGDVAVIARSGSVGLWDVSASQVLADAGDDGVLG